MQLIVGHVVRPHGIRGEVVVQVRTDEPDVRFAVGSALRTEPTVNGRDSADAGAADGARWQPPAVLTVEGARWHHGRLIVQFDGVYDRNLAEGMRGLVLFVDSADVAPPEDPDEFHDHQLVGLRAVDPTGAALGVIARVDHAPASDLLVLRKAGGGTALVPFVKAIVPEVDLAGQRVVVDPPRGLLDL